MGLRILVAEDNAFTAEQYQKALEKQGHEVILTNNGEDCLEKYTSELGKTEFDSIESHPFDLVLLDHNMSKKSGTKAAKGILSKKPNQKIIFASAYLKSEIEDQVNEKVFEKLDILEKPFSLSTLLRRVNSNKKKS